MADLDGDGFPDLCLTRSQFGSEHRIYLNDGAGGFTPGPGLPGGGFVSGIAVADLNHDGRPDLVMSSEHRPGEVWLGDGAGGFTRSPQVIPVQASGVDIGDVDGDGDIDLVFSGAASQVWLNNRRPLAGTPPAFTVPKNGRLDYALPGSLLSTASDPDGDPVTVMTMDTIAHRRATLGLIWMEFGNVPTTYEGDWPDGQYVYTETRPVAASHGTLTLNADGTFTYTPKPGYLGPDSFTYRVTDGVSESAPVTVNLTVTGEPDEPEARPDWYPDLDFTLQLDGNHIIGANFSIAVPAESGVLANDLNGNDLPLTAQLVTGPSHGTLTLSPDGSFTYQSFSSENYGIDEFTYRIVAGALVSPPARVALGTRAIVLRDDFYPSPAGAPLARDIATGVLANDTDPNANLPASESGAFSSLESPPAHGTVTLYPGGAFNYVPNPGYNGPDSFTYSAWAGLGYGFYPTARVKLGNTPPVAAADGGYRVFADRTLNVPAAQGVLANDSDPDGDPQLTAVLASGPSSGTLALHPDGSFTCTAAAGFIGSATFTYRVSDGIDLSAPATVTIAVAGIMDLVAVTPAAHSSSALDASLIRATFSRDLAAASVAGHVVLTRRQSKPAAFTTSVAGSVLTLTPATGFYAGEKLTILLKPGLEGTGGESLSAPLQFDVIVEGPSGSGTLADGGQILGDTTYSSSGIAMGDLNGDGFPDIVIPNGLTDFTPGAPFIGARVWFGNAAGTFADSGQALGTVSTSRAVLADLDGDGDLDLVLRASSGGARIFFNNGSGVFSEGPQTLTTELLTEILVADVNGDGHPDLVGYEARVFLVWLNDGRGSFTARPDAAARLNLANRTVIDLKLADLDGDGDLDAVARQFSSTAPLLVWRNDGRGAFEEFGSFGSGEVGLALGDLNGDGAIDVFAPTPNGPFIWLNDGNANFTPTAQTYENFRVSQAAMADMNGDGSLDLVVIQRTIPPGFLDPFFNRSTVYINDGQGRFTNSGQVIGNFGAASNGGDRLPTSFTLADANRDGAIDLFVTRGFREPNEVRLNTATLPVPTSLGQLTIKDTETARPFENVSLRVAPTDLVSLTVAMDDPAKGTLLSASLAAAGFTGPVGGVFSRPASPASAAEAALRQLVFGPAANRRPVGQAETTTFTLAITRGAQTRTDDTSAVASVSVNDPPVAADDSGAGFTTTESAVLTTASVLANDSDPDPGDALSMAAFDASGTPGAVTHLGNGVFQYDPRGRFTALGAGESATDSFIYVVEDPHGARAAARVFITVNGENQPPSAAVDHLTIRENSGQNVITATVLANDTDPDAGDALRLQIVSVATTGTLGTVQLGADGSLTYSPVGSGPNLGPGATRADSFGYTVRDPAGATASAQVSIVIVGENDPPALAPVTFTATEDAPAMNVTPNLLAAASDPDPGHTATLRIIRMDGSAGGGQAWLEDGLARYFPDDRFAHLQDGETAVDSFDYEVADELGAATRGTAKVLIVGVNSPPRLNPAYPVLLFSRLPQAVTSFLLSAATDPDDAPGTLRVDSVDTTGTQGSVFLAGGAAYYLPPPSLALADGEFFTDTFHFTVRDPHGAASAPALATVFLRGDEAAIPADPDPCPGAGSGGAILIHHLASAEATATHVALPESARSSHSFTGPFTVEFWMNLRRPSGWAFDHEALITKGDSAWRVQRRANTRHLAFDVTGLEPLILRSEREVVHGWHHVAAVYDGRYKLLYIDGELDAWAEVTGTPAVNNHPVWLGANSERPGRNFHGAMDEVRIWNHARTAGQIRDHLARTLTGHEPGLLTYYRFDEPTGDLVPNSVSGAAAQPGIAFRQNPDRAPDRFASEIGRSDPPVMWEFGTLVLGRHVFYNHSAFDGNDPAASAADDGALAPDKTALLPGQHAGFTHYTSYRKGLNGLMVDVARLRAPQAITAADFLITTGNDSNPAAWSAARPPRAVTVRPGAGVCGSDRITLVWDAHDAGTPHAAVAQGWLRVRLLANARTGLLFDDVFHFGNAIGESDDADSLTAAQDALRVLNHLTTAATITNPLDFNRDGLVAAQDALIVLNHIWTGFHRPDLRFGSWATVAAPWTGASEEVLRAEARRLLTDMLQGVARLTALGPQADGTLRLEYLLPPGRRARLEAAPALGAPWRPVAGPVLDGPADGRGAVRLPAPEAAAQFYRLELLPPDAPR